MWVTARNTCIIDLKQFLRTLMNSVLVHFSSLSQPFTHWEPCMTSSCRGAALLACWTITCRRACPKKDVKETLRSSGEKGANRLISTPYDQPKSKKVPNHNYNCYKSISVADELELSTHTWLNDVLPAGVHSDWWAMLVWTGTAQSAPVPLKPEIPERISLDRKWVLEHTFRSVFYNEEVLFFVIFLTETCVQATYLQTRARALHLPSITTAQSCESEFWEIKKQKTLLKKPDAFTITSL